MTVITETVAGHESYSLEEDYRTGEVHEVCDECGRSWPCPPMQAQQVAEEARA